MIGSIRGVSTDCRTFVERKQVRNAYLTKFNYILAPYVPVYPVGMAFFCEKITTFAVDLPPDDTSGRQSQPGGVTSLWRDKGLKTNGY